MQMAPVIGHRGCAGHAPENTLAGIRDAARVGCDWIEADATLLADGTVVLFHDDTLDRCTDGTGFIRRQNWTDLVPLDAGGWYGDGRFVGERVPLLSDALACCKALGIGFNIELKIHQGEGRELVRVVSKVITDCDHGPLLVSSYDHDALGETHEDILKGALFDRLPEDWQKVECNTVHLWSQNVVEDHVRNVKAAGKEVYVFTVNDKAEAKHFYDMGVDGVFSDYPDRLRD